MHVLVIGSSSVDLFAKPINEGLLDETEKKVYFNLGDKIPVEVYNLSLGGNASNVVSGLKALGLEVALYTYLGSDSLSKHIEDSLLERGIDLIAEKREVKRFFDVFHS